MRTSGMAGRNKYKLVVRGNSCLYAESVEPLAVQVFSRVGSVVQGRLAYFIAIISRAAIRPSKRELCSSWNFRAALLQSKSDTGNFIGTRTLLSASGVS